MDELFQENSCFHLFGDSTKSKSYEVLLKGEKVPLIIADPPFCLLTRRRKKGDLRDPKKNKNEHIVVSRFESVKDYRLFSQDWMEPASETLDKTGVFCIWTNFLGKDPIKKVAEKLGLFFWGEFEWVKLTKEGGGNERLGRIYEVALVFSKIEKPQIKLDDPAESWSVVSHYDEEGTAEKWGSHPNHKPFKVLEPLVRSYSKVGERVLDPFCGSGSGPSAMIQLNRLVSGLEITKEWTAMTRKRITSLLKK